MYMYNILYKEVQVKSRIDKEQLFDVLETWNHFLRRKVHLIACGGTAMTLCFTRRIYG
jgi:hypothetical protein